MKGICKSQRIKERQLHCKGERLEVRGERRVWYRRDLFDPQLIHLRNGTLLRQPIIDVPLYINQQGIVYTLTRFGLRPLRTNFWKKNHYGWRTRNGNYQGQIYPYVIFRKVTYRIHVLMADAWFGPRETYEAIDHINGNIDDNRLVNLRIVSKAENYRCGGILKRLRNASVRLNEPRLNPINIPQERLLEIFEGKYPITVNGER